MFALLTGQFDDAIVQFTDVDANGLLCFRKQSCHSPQPNHRCVGQDSEAVSMAEKPF
jgi:hypothetical protein